MFSVFGSIALLLTVMGLYGVLPFRVAQRTHEIGVRMALGATRATVRRLVIADDVGLTAFGVALGLGIALAGNRLFASLITYRPAAHDGTASECAAILRSDTLRFAPAAAP